MSLAQIEQEVTTLNPEELRHLQATINARLKPRTSVVTPETLAERRRLLDEARGVERGFGRI